MKSYSRVSLKFIYNKQDCRKNSNSNRYKNKQTTACILLLVRKYIQTITVKYRKTLKLSKAFVEGFNDSPCQMLSIDRRTERSPIII